MIPFLKVFVSSSKKIFYIKSMAKLNTDTESRAHLLVDTPYTYYHWKPHKNFDFRHVLFAFQIQQKGGGSMTSTK